MLISRYVYLLLLSGLLFATTSHATHIVGGEMNYRYLSENTYEINLTLYRDCSNTNNASYDNPACIGLFNIENELVRFYEFQFRGSDTIPLSINYACAKLPQGICYEYTNYIDTLYLQPISGGYQVVYQRCCWNLTVNNIKNDGDQGSSGLTVMAKIPDVNNIPVNSNPVFQELTSPYICLGTEFIFNHAAVDPDGDSLAYRIVTPFNAAIRSTGQYCPQKPPYQKVNYSTGYSIENVMGGEPLKVDPVTGLVTAKPKINGQFVYAVEVIEYRNGIEIGSTQRSYQLNTVICPDLTYAYIKSPDILCGQKSVDFGNLSIGASSYVWNFGDPTNPAAGSTDSLTSYVFPDTGKYKVTLIAVSKLDSVVCDDTTFREITLTGGYSVNARYNQDICLNQAQFKGDATIIGSTPNKYYWEFGDGQISTFKDPLHVFPQNREYTVKLWAELDESHLGCADSVEITYNGIYNVPSVDATANKYTLYKRADSVFLNANSPDAITYSWKPTRGLSDPTIKNPVAKPEETTTYIVKITNANGCVNRDTVTLNINPYRCGESEIYIPNAFTPNNDGENDYFRVRGEDIKELYLGIYNRWGQLVYESTDVYMIQNESFGWDGTYNGEALSTGVFVYYLKAICPGDNEFIKKGNVTLLR